MRPPAYLLAEQLDRELGDPNDVGCVFGYRRLAELDRGEEFPTEAVAALDALGLPRHYVPAAFGGTLDGYDALMMTVRMLARRDFTVALAHAKTYLGAACTWIGGSPDQATDLAGKVLAGDPVSLALTEEAHGSDLLGGEVIAEPTEGGLRVSGHKWLINNATRGRVLCVLARTQAAGGPRGFSLLLMDKRDLEPDSFTPLPALRTHGVRGADISGIGFADALVPDAAVIGEPGAGLEVVLKSMQLTRPLCGALSLGVGDHALRLAVDFATAHRIYGRPVIDLPMAARSLATAYVDLLTAEVVTLLGMRSLHALPGEQSITAAIVKYWVPTVVDRTIAALSRVLGARALLVDDFADGRFQKLQRDHQVVGIFDGSTHVNQNALINQFPALVRGYRQVHHDAAGLAAAVTLDGALAPFDRSALRLTSRAGCSVVQALPDAVAELVTVQPGLAGLGGELLEIVDDLHERLAAYRPAAREVPDEAFALAARYADCFAAAACVHVWLRNHAAAAVGGAGLTGGGGAVGGAGLTGGGGAVRDAGGAGLWLDGTWLAACLARLVDRLRPARAGGDHSAALDRMLPHLRVQHAEGLLLSLISCRLTGERRGPDR